MKLLRILGLILLLSPLVACSASTKLDRPYGVDKHCEQPVLLPEKELTQKEVEVYWSQDRFNLIKCSQFNETKNVFIESLTQ